MTLKRRKFIQSLNMEHIERMSSNVEQLKLLFNEDSPYKLRAGIDIAIIEAYILA